MSGNAPVRLIVPFTEKLIVSEPLPLPAAHSPATRPDAVFVLAAVIASRKVHKPSVPSETSEVLLTVIVLPSGVLLLPTASRRALANFGVAAEAAAISDRSKLNIGKAAGAVKTRTRSSAALRA